MNFIDGITTIGELIFFASLAFLFCHVITDTRLQIKILLPVAPRNKLPHYFTPKVIRPNGEEFSFEIDAFKKNCLVNGLDKIGLTLEKGDKIASFEKERSENFPWLDGAAMKVPDTIPMYPSAQFWSKEEVSA